MEREKPLTISERAQKIQAMYIAICEAQKLAPIKYASVSEAILDQIESYPDQDFLSLEEYEVNFMLQNYDLSMFQ